MKARNRKIKEEMDTNVMAVDFKVLKDGAVVVAGDPVFCKQCKAVFNKHSKLEAKPEDFKAEDMDDDDQIWNCEFCNTQNIVNLEQPEIPTEDTVNYILEPAKVKEGGEGNQSVIFCVDISGSMCVTTPIQGKFHIKGDRMKELQDFAKFGDGSDQFMQGESRNTTYVSRLQCVQASIES